MSIDYTNAKIGQPCPNCGGKVHVSSMQKFLNGDRKARVIVRCDCYVGTYRLSNAERAELIRGLH